MLKHRPFVDPWNPSPGEIRAWAYDAESLEPCQDFKLALSWSWHEKAFLECVSDDRCPKRRYFLDVLYLIVGNAARNDYQGTPRPIVEGFISFAAKFSHPDLIAWRRRSLELLEHPERFDYDTRCAGGLVESDSHHAS